MALAGGGRGGGKGGRRPKKLDARSITVPGFLVAADALVPCKACGALEGEPCKPTFTRPVSLALGYVHFGRRISRLLLIAGATAEERARVEVQLLELLVAEQEAYREVMMDRPRTRKAKEVPSR